MYRQISDIKEDIYRQICDLENNVTKLKRLFEALCELYDCDPNSRPEDIVERCSQNINVT